MFAIAESTSSTVATLNKGTKRILCRSKLLNPSVGSAGFAHRTSILVTHPVSMILNPSAVWFPRPAVAPPRRRIFHDARSFGAGAQHVLIPIAAYLLL